MLEFIISIAMMFGIMYFLLIRPQKKQQEKVQDMLSSLEPGDSIVTIGGLHGVIDEVNPEANTVVLDCEGIYLTFERRSIARVISKGTASVQTTEEIIVEEAEKENLDESEE